MYCQSVQKKYDPRAICHKNNINLFPAKVEYPSLRVPDLGLDPSFHGTGLPDDTDWGRGRGTLRQLRQPFGEPLLKNSEIPHR